MYYKQSRCLQRRMKAYISYTNEWKDMTQKKIAFPRQKIGATFIPMTVIMSALDDMNMKDVR